MTMRANYFELAPDAMQILMKQEEYLKEQFSISDLLTPMTLELVKLRISQINQCAFCVDMHSKVLLSQGESQQRIVGLSAWKDMPFYSQIEREVLDYAERLTFGESIDDVRYKQIVRSLGEQALVNLTVAINAINSWNRIAKTFKPEIGSFKP